jgi:predicted MFS family arabinose efflux permease
MMQHASHQHRLPAAMIGILAITQVASWGSIYYAFAILAGDIQRDLGLPAAVVFGGYSWSLLVAGVLATPVGALLDKSGGRLVMGAGSLLAAGGLALLGAAQSAWMYWLAWTVIGIAMSLVLYEAAFAAVNRASPDGARRGISILTLFGGFASTLFWPLTLKLGTLFGWRDTYFIYAAIQLFLCAPLHALLPAQRSAVARPTTARPGYTLAQAVRHPVFWRLAAAFAANSFVFSALTVHLIPLLSRMGHPFATAVLFAALIGPLQVAGRVGEMAFAKWARPQVVGRLIFTALPIALAMLLLMGRQQWAAAGFCLLYGLSNGIMTIVRGTLPAALFGTDNYGAISGALAGPALLFKAAGPLCMAWFIGASHAPTGFLVVLMLVSLGSLACYLAAIRLPASLNFNHAKAL